MLRVYLVKYRLVNTLDPELEDLLIPFVSKNLLNFYRWMFVVMKNDIQTLERRVKNERELELLRKLNEWISRYGEGEFCVVLVP